MSTTTLRNASDLVGHIEDRIARGHLRPGDRLDPVRTAATELGLAPNTVASAYRTLGERGFVIGEGRRGTFVASRPALRAPIADVVPPDLIDLRGGNPDPVLLPDLGMALSSISPAHTLYGDDPIDPTLERVMRTDLDSDGVGSGHLAVVGGALDGIERVLEAHLRPGDRVAIEDPGYSSIIELIAAMGLRAVPVDIDEYGPRPDSLERGLRAGVAAWILTPRAQNPTGASLDEQRASDLRSIVQSARDLLIVEDDHAGRVAGQPYVSVVSPDRERWAVVRSMAKSLGPDLRVAFLSGDESTIRRVAGRQVLGTGWVSHLLQRTVAVLLGSTEIIEGLDRAATIYTERRGAVVEALRAEGITCSARSGLNIWIPVNDEAAVVTAMQTRGWAIRSGARYRIDSGPGVRVSVAATPSDTLTAAAVDLAEILRSGTAARSV